MSDNDHGDVGNLWKMKDTFSPLCMQQILIHTHGNAHHSVFGHSTQEVI